MVGISIVFAGSNGADNLYDRLQALLDQSVVCQIIAVDCGSTDDSWEILSDCAGQFPEDIRAVHLDSTDLHAGWNAGLQLADGEYVVFLQWGDGIDADFCRTLYEAAQGADIVGGDYSGALQTQEQRLDALLRQGRGAKAYRRAFLQEQGLTFPENMEFGYLGFEFLTIALAQSAAGVYAGLNKQRSEPPRNDRRWYERMEVPGYILQQSRERGLLQTCPDLVEFRYITLQMGNVKLVCLGKFDTPSEEKLEQIRQQLARDYPDFPKGKYYKKALWQMRHYLKLLMVSPRKVIASYRHDSWNQFRGAIAERFEKDN